ncbi:MAG: nitrile hydratase subunit beta [Beijerinckiaceae bacterium]
MNGPQDMGGQMGHGPVVVEKDEPLFHEPWEARVMGLVVATGPSGMWNLDITRHARESLPPAEYLTVGYYGIWVRGLAKVLADAGMVSAGELASGKALEPPVPVKRVLKAADVPAVLAKGSPYDRPAKAPPRFAVGDRVRALNDHVTTHTRLPRYARGVTGEIESVQGCFVLPDSNAHGKGEDPHWCYGVRFSAVDLWGAGADPTSEVMIDLWEPYLAAA